MRDGLGIGTIAAVSIFARYVIFLVVADAFAVVEAAAFLVGAGFVGDGAVAAGLSFWAIVNVLVDIFSVGEA